MTILCEYGLAATENGGDYNYNTRWKFNFTADLQKQSLEEKIVVLESKTEQLKFQLKELVIDVPDKNNN